MKIYIISLSVGLIVGILSSASVVAARTIDAAPIPATNERRVTLFIPRLSRKS